MSHPMTDREVNEVLARFRWPDLEIELIMEEGIRLIGKDLEKTHSGEYSFDPVTASLYLYKPRFDKSLDACRRIELKLRTEGAIARYQLRDRIWRLEFGKEWKSEIDSICKDPALVAHALAEVIVERGMG